MQGQRSTGSLPDPINFDFGSTSTNIGMEQQIRWNNLRDPSESRLSDYRVAPSGADAYMGTITQEARNLSRWSIGESSSSNPQNLNNNNNHDEQMTPSGWWSSLSTTAGGGVGQRQDSQLYEPSIVASRNSVNLNLSINQIPSEPSHVVVGGGVDPMDCSNSSKTGALEHRLFPSSSGSEPFASSSRSGGFLVEEDNGRTGSRLSCKRKTIEGNVGQSSNSGSYFSREGSNLWLGPPPPYNTGGGSSSSLNMSPQIDPVNSRLELSMVGFAPDNNTLHTSAAETSQRNHRSRTNPSNHHQDFSSHNSSRPHVVAQPIPPGQCPSFFVPRVTAEQLRPGECVSFFPQVTPEPIQTAHPPPRTAPLNPPPQLDPYTGPRVVAEPHPPGHPLYNRSVRFSGASRQTAGERGTPAYEDLSSRPIFARNAAQQLFMRAAAISRSLTPPNEEPDPYWNWNGEGSIPIPRNTGSSSRAGVGSSSHSTPGGPSWGSSRRHPSSSQYSRRLTEYVRRSLLTSAGSEIGSTSADRSIPSSSSSQEVGLPSGGGTHGDNNQPLSRSAPVIDRHGDGVTGNSYSLRTLPIAGEGRTRLVSEIRSVLDMMRRGEGLRFEDVMILDPSVLFGMADINDQHRDMRLDVDNMSYEELLALEERIGSVSTGITAETVAARLKRRKYFAITRSDQAEVEPCCICQEEYRSGEDLGTLDCGHDFHTECIKQWLGQKNLCPICKTTALAS